MTAPAETLAPVMVASEVLGPIPVAPDQVVTFIDGLYGFPGAQRFALLPTPRDGVLWLQSLEFSALVFLLVDPFQVFPHYHIELSESDKARLGTDAEDILILAIVTMPPEPSLPCTANLHAPLMFNVRAGQGYQSIRPDDTFGIREEFSL